MYCDSKSALQRISDLFYDGFGTTWRCRANYDLESAIRASLHGQHSTFSWIWIKGHAARRKKRQDFSWAETLNDCADGLATEAGNARQSPDTAHWPDQQVSIDGPYGRMSGQLDKSIRYCCTSRDLFSYWQQRYGWTITQLLSIDIEGTRGASSSLRPEMARNI